MGARFDAAVPVAARLVALLFFFLSPAILLWC